MKKFLIPLLLTPAAALAHPGHHHHEAAPFMAGLSHPMGGADHLLAMVAVGLWAASIGGRAVWALPLTFIAAMIAGGALGAAGGPPPRQARRPRSSQR